MDLDALLPAILAAAVAVLGYLATYVNNIRLGQRQERLDRVNRQLGELYGPLLALSEANRIAYEAFLPRGVTSRMERALRERSAPATEDFEEWQTWAIAIFAPGNRRMYETIIEKADLLLEGGMPDVLLEFCAHVSTFEVLLAKWARDDYSETTTAVAFPGPHFNEYVGNAFRLLKQEQARLLGSETGA